MCQPQYYLREIDEFSTVDGGKLSKQLYDRILNEFLHRVATSSIVTKIPMFVAQLLKHLCTDPSSEPIQSEYSVEINTWPLVFTEDENRQIAMAVAKNISPMFAVSVKSYDYASLSDELISAQYPCFILYNCTKWFNDRGDSILKGVFRTTHIYAPKLNFVRPLTEEEMSQLEDTVDPFTAFEMACGPLIDITFIPVGFYCANTPANKDEYVNQFFEQIDVNNPPFKGLST